MTLFSAPVHTKNEAFSKGCVFKKAPLLETFPKASVFISVFKCGRYAKMQQKGGLFIVVSGLRNARTRNARDNIFCPAISFPELTCLLVSTKTPCLGADQKTRGLWERDCLSDDCHKIV